MNHKNKPIDFAAEYSKARRQIEESKKIIGQAIADMNKPAPKPAPAAPSAPDLATGRKAAGIPALLRQQAKQAGLTDAKIDNLIDVFGLEIAIGTIEDVIKARTTSAGKAAQSAAVGHKDASASRTPKPAPSSKAIMIPLPDDELERRRKLIKVPESLWTVMTRRLNEQQVYDLINDAMIIEGHSEIVDGSKTYQPFWGFYAKKGQTR